MIETLGPVPPPVRLDVSVPAPVGTLRLPVRVVLATEGVKVTFTAQFLLTARPVGQSVVAKLKSVLPVTEIAAVLMSSSTVPVLVRIAASVLADPKGTPPKFRAEVNVADCATVAVPCRVEVSGPAAVPTLRTPVRDPATPVGANVTLMVQCAPTPRLTVQSVDAKLKLVPVTEPAVGIVTVKGAEPVLVRVAGSVLDEFRLTLPKVSAVVRLADGVTPVPVRLELFGPAPVEILNVPVLKPVELGANCTMTLQLVPTLREAGQLVEAKLKPGPVTEPAVGTVTVKATAPVLASVAVSVLDEPTFTLPKARGVVRLADGVESTPVPVRLELFGPAPVVMLNVPVLKPVEVGRNCTVTAQLVPTAREAGQVVDTKL